MTKIHEKKLQNIDDSEIKSFSDSGLKRAYFCKDSGKLYSPECMLDPRGSRCDVGYFESCDLPCTPCDIHIVCEYDELTEALATHGCPSENLKLVSLLHIENRNFPKEIIITDAEYVYREMDESIPLAQSYDVPYFLNLIPEGEYVGRGRRKKQFNSSCYLHND